jgi:ribonuclease HII
MTGARVPRRKSAAVAEQPGFNFNTPDEIVCGVDEAGRGPLAGPVVAAAVIFDPSKPMIRGLDDSKALTAKKRDELYDKIVERALAYSIASASVEEIDTLNILHATMLAMKRAVEGLAVVPTLVKIDGNRCPVLGIRSEAIIGGDAGQVHFRGFDSRQGHARPDAAPVTSDLSSLRFRRARGLRHAAASGGVA